MHVSEYPSWLISYFVSAPPSWVFSTSFWESSMDGRQAVRDAYWGRGRDTNNSMALRVITMAHGFKW